MRSKSALVSPAVTAIARPCIISGASSPSMCAPTTRPLPCSTTSFITLCRLRPLRVWRMGVKRARKMSARPRAAASSSLRPTLASGGEKNTAFGVVSNDHSRVLPA